MRRLLCLAIVPILVGAQSVPLSFLKIEEEPGSVVLRVRNLYDAPATGFVLGCEELDGRVHTWTRWDVLLIAEAQVLAPGETRQFSATKKAGNWKTLAVIYADGAVSGSPELIRSILEDRETVAIQLARASEILSNPLDPQAAVESWFQGAKHSQNERVQLLPGGPARVLPVMARMAVPRYVKMQLAQGNSPQEILDSLRIWQRRLAAYRLDMMFL
jgi:glutaredoxin-related protein